MQSSNLLNSVIKNAPKESNTQKTFKKHVRTEKLQIRKKIA